MRYFIYSFLIFNYLLLPKSNFAAQKDTKTFQNTNYSNVFLMLQKDTIPNTGDTLIATDSTLEVLAEKVTYYDASKAANDLKNGVLVVLLRTNEKRLKDLEILSRNPNFTDYQRASINQKIGALEAETKRINGALIRNFKGLYNFSAVYFMYDRNIEELKKGVKKGIFVNDSAVVDVTITLPETDFFVCNYAIAGTANTAEGLIILNSKMERMKPPFPTVTVAGSSSANALLQLLTKNDDYETRIIARDIEKLQRNLEALIKKKK